MHRKDGYLAAWLLVLLAGHVVAFAVVWGYFVHTRHGQLLDTIALTGDLIGRRHIDGLVGTVLNAISVLSLAAATAVIGSIALIRRRLTLALVAVLLIGGSNVTTQVMKYGFHRPDLGVDGALTGYGNSLPSGHATVAGSVAAGLVLVLPPRLRGPVGLLGAGYAALTGVATLSAGWHRPSDAVASLLVVGGWSAFAGLLLVLLAGPDRVVRTRDAHPIAISVLALAGVTLLAAAGVGLTLTDQVVATSPTQLGTRRLFAAYAGSAAGIAGTASLVMAFLLTSAHAVVARRGDEPPGTPAPRQARP
jgi:membrane-associated phospholipid phosphatase